MDPAALIKRWRGLIARRAVRRGVLAIIVAGAALLSLYWAFLVPIFEAPDEPSHLDYALTIYSFGGLVNLRDRETFPYYGYAHPYTYYLMRETGFPNIPFMPAVRVQPDYGRPAYYTNIDQGAPAVPSPFVPIKNPTVVYFYPFGYYALVAAWLALLGPLHLGLVGMFFSARILSVLLLAITLPLTYAVARELKVGPTAALALTAVIGFMPLTSYVSSYVQPDNLSFTLVTLCVYLAVRARRANFAAPWMVALGVALGALLVTKYQFYVCVVIPVAAMFVAEMLFAPGRHRPHLARSGLAALAAPSLLLGAVQLWVVAGGHTGISSDPSIALITTAPFTHALRSGPVAFLSYTATDLRQAFESYYLGGQSFFSFWGAIGWETQVVIRSARFTSLFERIEIAATVVLLGLLLVRLALVAWRLLSVARRGRWRWALRIACANPFLNSYFIFTITMFGLFVITDASFGPQGRNWIPYLFPAFAAGAIYAPRALPHRLARSAATTLVLAALLVYAGIGAYYAVQTVQQRYYGPGLSVASLDLAGKQPVSSGYTVETSTPTALNWPNIPQGAYVSVTGWAVDLAGGTPAGAALATVDGSLDFPGVYGTPRPDVASQLGRPSLENSGFSIMFSTNGLAPGPHYLTVKVVSQDGSRYYETPERIDFTVVG